jgi:hypothetical protein
MPVMRRTLLEAVVDTPQEGDTMKFDSASSPSVLSARCFRN